MKRYIVALSLFVFPFVGCTKSSGGGERILTPVSAASPLSATITSHPKSAFSTTSPAIDLSGRLTGSPASLRVMSDAGFILSLNPESDWEVADVPLIVGETTITVEVSDTNGQVASDSVVVTRMPDVTFDEGRLTPDLIFTGPQSSPIAAEYRIVPDAQVSITNAQLWQCSPEGHLLMHLGALTDDGNSSNGDREAGDGIYSAIFIVSGHQETDCYVRPVVLLSTGERNGPVARLQLLQRPSANALGDAVATVQQLSSTYSAEGREAALDAATRTHALDTVYDHGEHGFSVQFGTGIRAAVIPEVPQGTPESSSQRISQPVGNVAPAAALIVNPFNDLPWLEDLQEEFTERTSALWQRAEVTHLRGVDVISSELTIPGSGVVYLAGVTAPVGYQSSEIARPVQDGYSAPFALAYVTAESGASQAIEEYLTGRAVLVGVAGENQVRVGLTPAFFSREANLGNSLVALSALHGGSNGSLAKAMLASAEVCRVYEGEVDLATIEARDTEFFNAFLIRNKTVSQALAEEQVAGVPRVAYGNVEYDLYGNNVIDSSFESFFPGWEFSGIGSRETEYYGVNPVTGSQLGVIATGPNLAGNLISRATQRVAIPRWATKLVVSVDVVSHCTPAKQNELFLIQYNQDGFINHTLHYEYVGTLCPNMTTLTGGLKHTMYRRLEIDISNLFGSGTNLAGSSGVLQFTFEGLLPNINQWSAAVVDDITFER